MTDGAGEGDGASVKRAAEAAAEEGALALTKGQRFESGGVRVRGSILRNIVMYTLLAVVGLPTFCSCAPIWGLLVYAVLRLSAYLERTRQQLRGAVAASVTITDEAIVIDPYLSSDRSARLPRAAVVDGWLEPAADHEVCVIRLSFGRRLLVRVDDEDEGRLLLRALGIDAGQQFVRMPIASRALTEGRGALFHLGIPYLLTIATFVTIIILILGWEFESLVAVGACLFLLFLTVLTVVYARYVVPRKIAIGTDGFAIRHLGRETFYPFDQVTNIKHMGDWLSVAHAGKSLALKVGSFADREPRGILRAVEQRLLQSLAAFNQRSTGEPLDRQLLDRRGRSLSAWREELDKLLEPGSAYRGRRIDIASLADVVDDASESSERRLAAAMVLQRAGVESQRERAQSAASGCANKRLRIALSKALQGELEAQDVDLLEKEEAPKRLKA